MTLSGRNVRTKFFLAASFLLLFASCKKEGDIGVDVLPGSDIVDLQTTDTTLLVTYTVREDSVRSDESSVIQIGSYNELTFGTTTAGLFTQLSIANDQQNVNLGSSAVLDSAQLWLAYQYDFYGDTNAQQTFNIYQVTQDLYKDSAYYSNHPKQVAPGGPFQTYSFTPHPRTNSLNDHGATVSPFLRIPMDSAWTQHIFNQSGQAGLSDNTAFHQFMKGIYIEAAPTNTTLLRFIPKDSLTRFTMYYHIGTTPKTFSFVINSSTAYYSYFTHTYSPGFTSQLNTPGLNNVYVQGAAGVKTKIEFPNLSGWQGQGPIAINKAELVIKAEPATDPNTPINKQLYLVSLDSNGNQYLLLDMFENSVYYGGQVDTDNNEYRINMARYFQQLVDGEQGNYGMYLKELDPVQEGRRTVLGSSTSTTYKMYLHLVYTRIN